MLHILLLILKIIGIVLAILTGCILIGLCLVLFLPVHYRIELNRTEGEGSPPIEARAKLTWLMHFMNIGLQYPADVYLRVRILFFTLFRLPQKHKEGKKEKNASNRKSKKKKEDKGRGQNETGKEANANKNDIENAKQARIEHEAEDKCAEEMVEAEQVKPEAGNQQPEAEIRQAGQPAEGVRTERNTDNQPKEQSAAEAKDKSGETELSAENDTEDEEIHDTKLKLSLKSKIDKICSQIKNIWSKIKNIRYTIKRICDKIKEILENIEYYMDVIKSDTFKRAFSLCKDELGAVFKYVKPRKFNADLIIGMDDPAATGQILSYYGMLYPLIGDNVTVSGDFDRKRIEGSVFVKGKIRLFTFLKAVIRIYFNKDIRKLLKLFKKEDV